MKKTTNPKSQNFSKKIKIPNLLLSTQENGPNIDTDADAGSKGLFRKRFIESKNKYDKGGQTSI